MALLNEATERLRAMLDERGVEYETADSYRCKFTLWRNNGIDAGWDDSENWEQPHLLIIGFTPEQAIEATVGSDSSDTVKRLMKLQGGHYGWPMLYEAVTGDPYDYECSASKSEEVFIEKLISIVGGRKVES